MAKLHFDGKSYEMKAGDDLLGVLLENNATISYLCMSGSCGTCRVRMCAGAEHVAPVAAMEASHGCDEDDTRLACQTISLGTGDVHIESL
jgi:ferredoxin